MHNEIRGGSFWSHASSNDYCKNQLCHRLTDMHVKYQDTLIKQSPESCMLNFNPLLFIMKPCAS